MNEKKYRLMIALFFVYLIVSMFQIISLNFKTSVNKGFTVTYANDPQVYSRTIENTKAKIEKDILSNPLSPSEIIKVTMEYVHNNSLHLIDDEHRKYSGNIPHVLNKIYLASEGDVSEKPHLSCGPRAYAMKTILSQFNIYSRLVQIYSDEYETHEAHRLLEVYNPDNQSWETWDPDYGVTYIDRQTNNSVDILSLVFLDKENFIPVGVSGEGWKKTKTEVIRDNYFESVLFETDGGMTNAVIIVNTDLFNMEKVFSSGLTFNAWAKKHYSSPRIIQLLNGELVL
jgi:hypothetical protein